MSPSPADEPGEVIVNVPLDCRVAPCGRVALAGTPPARPITLGRPDHAGQPLQRLCAPAAALAFGDALKHPPRIRLARREGMRAPPRSRGAPGVPIVGRSQARGFRVQVAATSGRPGVEHGRRQRRGAGPRTRLGSVVAAARCRGVSSLSGNRSAKARCRRCLAARCGALDHRLEQRVGEGDPPGARHEKAGADGLVEVALRDRARPRWPGHPPRGSGQPRRRRRRWPGRVRTARRSALPRRFAGPFAAARSPERASSIAYRGLPPLIRQMSSTAGGRRPCPPGRGRWREGVVLEWSHADSRDGVIVECRQEVVLRPSSGWPGRPADRRPPPVARRAARPGPARCASARTPGHPSLQRRATADRRSR